MGFQIMAESDRVRQRALLARAFLSEATRMVACQQAQWRAMSYSARARYQAECLERAERAFRESEDVDTSEDTGSEYSQLWLPIVRGSHPDAGL